MDNSQSVFFVFLLVFTHFTTLGYESNVVILEEFVIRNSSNVNERWIYIFRNPILVFDSCPYNSVSAIRNAEILRRKRE